MDISEKIEKLLVKINAFKVDDFAGEIVDSQNLELQNDAFNSCRLYFLWQKFP